MTTRSVWKLDYSNKHFAIVNSIYKYSSSKYFEYDKNYKKKVPILIATLRGRSTMCSPILSKEFLCWLVGHRAKQNNISNSEKVRRHNLSPPFIPLTLSSPLSLTLSVTYFTQRPSPKCKWTKNNTVSVISVVLSKLLTKAFKFVNY